MLSYRKLAGLLYLILNGSLTSNGILFWDEPEANLNPKLTRIVVNVLQILADAGIQIFIATHDYLLSNELSLIADYKPESISTRFFAFYKPNKRGGVEVEAARTLSMIQNNPILDEFAAHYDREVELFRSTSDQP